MANLYEDQSQDEEALDDATHAAADVFKQYGLIMGPDDLHQINDRLADWLKKKLS